MPGAHALNHSHPEELVALIVEFLDDRPVGGVDIDGLRVLAGS